MKETRQECIDCGGKCCQIYLFGNYQPFYGPLPKSKDEFISYLATEINCFIGDKDYGVTPLFDPLKAHLILS